MTSPIVLYCQLQAFCYQGSCQSRLTRCQQWWGPDQPDAANVCYTNLNARGLDYGHCAVINRTAGIFMPCNARYFTSITFTLCSLFGACLRLECKITTTLLYIRLISYTSVDPIAVYKQVINRYNKFYFKIFPVAIF